jgi:hypothetical protein
MKSGSLFSEGLKPVVYSKLWNLKNQKVLWTRANFSAVSYAKNSFMRDGHKTSTYYQLSFSYTFPDSNDEVFFAHSFPYTYTYLCTFLKQLSENP